MCVILACEKTFPSWETLKNAEDLNGDGGGIAWIEKGKVHFKKNLTADKIHKMITSGNIKLPVIIHFRITSVGGTKPSLCHPFPITRKADTALTGKTAAVLFHNGTWTQWQDYTLATLMKTQVRMPKGDWSDSRAMAFMAGHLGKKTLKHIEGWNKIAILTTKRIEYYGKGWVQVDKVKCSNNYFVPAPPVADKFFEIRDGRFTSGHYYPDKELKMTKAEKADRLRDLLLDAGYNTTESDLLVESSIANNTLDKDLTIDWYKQCTYDDYTYDLYSRKYYA